MLEVNTIEDTKQFPYSARLIMQEALRKGYKVWFFFSSPLKNSGITRAVKGHKEVYFKSTSTMLTPSFGHAAADDKTLTYNLLSSRGINTPVTKPLSYDEAVDPLLPLLSKYKTLVVKPADMNHGDGVSIGVDTKDKLKKAVDFARASGNRRTDIIAQQQVYGDEYRFLVVEGKVIAVASRKPPSVTGNGISTIQELVEEKNKDPRRGEGHSAELTLLDLEQIEHYKGKAFLRRVLKKGEIVNVLETSNLSKGGESVDFTDIASPALKKMAVDAANACFLGIAGVDVMTNDITSKTVDESYIIEVNIIPGIRMHQSPSVGKKRDVAKIIFRAIEKTARRVGKNT
jgi:cyanophycin synthetase